LLVFVVSVVAELAVNETAKSKIATENNVLFIILLMFSFLFAKL